jgi:hypothetical protein
MDNVEELDLEILDRELKPFLYKWTKGENDGKVCEYKDVIKDEPSGIIWINFGDGSRINYSLLDEYMMRIDSSAIVDPEQPNNAIETAGTKNVRNAIYPGKQLNPPKSNPIISLLEKQKPNWVNVDMKLELNLPTKSLYNVLTTSFEDAEDEIIEFVVRDLDIDVVKESLRINIREIYNKNGKSKIGIKTPSKEQESGDS